MVGGGERGRVGERRGGVWESHWGNHVDFQVAFVSKLIYVADMISCGYIVRGSLCKTNVVILSREYRE